MDQRLLERLKQACYRLEWGMFLPGAPLPVPQPPRTPKTLAVLLLQNGIQFPPAHSFIDVTTTDCGVVRYNKRWFIIMPERGKGYGIYTCKGLIFGMDLGKYDGLHTNTWKPSDYIMELKQCYIDGSPDVATTYFNNIPVGWTGSAVLAYINEPGFGEVPNVVYCEKDNGEDCHVVVAVDNIDAWKPLLVCYNSGKKCSNLHFHDCIECNCSDIADKAQKHFEKLKA